MNKFYRETADIFRLKLPFESVYTSVFLVKDEKKAYLVDCATKPKDVNTGILPALSAIGYALSDIEGLVLTHRHDDHAGGLSRILELSPHLPIITDTRQLSNALFTYSLPGHTKDTIGLLDVRTKTLISGDGLQGAGVDVYRCSLDSPKDYLETLSKIEADERIENILFSHAYEPWLADKIFSRDAVLACIKECSKYVER